MSTNNIKGCIRTSFENDRLYYLIKKISQSYNMSWINNI